MRDDMNRRYLIYDGEDVIEDSMREVEWHEVRAARDQALIDSDWRAVKDRILPTAWKDYRQALRNLGDFDSANDAADNWPVMPDA